MPKTILRDHNWHLVVRKRIQSKPLPTPHWWHWGGAEFQELQPTTQMLIWDTKTIVFEWSCEIRFDRMYQLSMCICKKTLFTSYAWDRGWAETKTKVCARTEISVFALGIQEIPAYRHTRKKAERFYFSAFISESENKILTLFQKGNSIFCFHFLKQNAEKQILSAFFLAVLTGMPVFPVVLSRKPKFRFWHKLSFSSLLNP